jgi:acetaldehyde dehydrogenase
MTALNVAIIGSGNIGTDLMVKVMRRGRGLKLVAMAGVDPVSEGLARARRLRVFVTDRGYSGLRGEPLYSGVDLIFDATSAAAHKQHAAMALEDGKQIIDLTPAAIGPLVVPAVNAGEHLDAPNINMVTCGGQATIPIVAAIGGVAPVLYAEIIASIASKSAGPGTRANIDEFTETTALGLKTVGGAGEAKAIIILNPAEPPLLMRDTVYCLVDGGEPAAIAAAVEAMVERVRRDVPGYRLKQAVQFDPVEEPARLPERLRRGRNAPLKVSVFLEVEGAGNFLPRYAGNLDIMTAAALACGEQIAERRLEGRA